MRFDPRELPVPHGGCAFTAALATIATGGTLVAAVWLASPGPAMLLATTAVLIATSYAAHRLILRDPR